MTADEVARTDDKRTWWAELPAPKQAKAWEDACPGTLERILTEIASDQRHARRLDWAYFSLRVLGMFCGFGTVVILALLGMYCVAHGAPTAAVGVFGFGTATIIGIFVTNRLRNRTAPDDDR